MISEDSVKENSCSCENESSACVLRVNEQEKGSELDVQHQQMAVRRRVNQMRSVSAQMHIRDPGALPSQRNTIPYHVVDHQSAVIAPRQLPSVQIPDFSAFVSPIHNIASLRSTQPSNSHGNRRQMRHAGQRFGLNASNQISARLVAIHIYP